MVSIAPNSATASANAASSPLFRRQRLHFLEPIYWLAALAAFFVFPDDLALGTSILTMALFALSLDLMMGFAGVVSLNHAVFFGIGAYAAGLLTIWGLHEPITGAILAGCISAVAAGIIGPLVLRFSGLPLMMVSLAAGGIVYEAANKLTWLTGGDNGLYGITVAPVFGLFRWTVYSNTAYLYALGWLFVLFCLVRLVVSSSFGIALQGIRENSRRMRLIGSPVLLQLLLAYIISGFVAGVAGAVLAQATQFVGLSVISLDNTIDVVVILVLGGTGRLYGGLIGAPIYMIIHQVAAQWNPYHWLFLIGGMLVVVVKLGHGGLLGIADHLVRRITGRRSGAAR